MKALITLLHDISNCLIAPLHYSQLMDTAPTRRAAIWLPACTLHAKKSKELLVCAGSFHVLSLFAIGRR
jgi:hypothetical protein